MHLISLKGILYMRDQKITVLNEKSLLVLIVLIINFSEKFLFTHLTASKSPLSRSRLIT